MSFIYPWFLFALAAIAVPIIIHLFHFRRFKKVYFSNIRFLQQLSDETQKQARLKHLLVLLSRILAISFLVMAFARPFIPHEEGGERPQGNKVNIFIDNSFSMEAGSAYGSVLDQAKQGATEIAELFDPTDKYQLLTNDFEASHQRFVNRDEFLGMLAEVNYSPAVRPVSEVMKRQSDLLKEEPGNENNLAFVLSDFQKNITTLEEISTDSLTDYTLIPYQAQQRANVFIDSVWIENPVRLSGQVITLETRIFNDSDERLENQPVRMYVNNTQRSVATFSVDPFDHAHVSLTYTLDEEPFQQGYLEITDHPVNFDDRFYFSFTLSESIPVMAINQREPNRYLNALLGNDTTFIYQNVQAGAIDYSLFGSQNLIILNSLPSIGSGLAAELRRYVEEGGHLMVFPAEKTDIPSYNEMLLSMGVAGILRKDTQNTRVTSINELHGTYSGVFERLPENMDLPEVQQYYVLDKQSRGREQFLMQLQNGNYFFTETPSGQGSVYVSAVPANESFSNFPRHAMFVPTLYNIALHSSDVFPLYYTIGEDDWITIRNYRPAPGELFTITGNQLEVIPETRNINNNIQLVLHNQIKSQQIYRLLAGDKVLRPVAFNYDRRESLLESYSQNEIQQFASEQANMAVFESDNVSYETQLEKLRGGTQLWRLFILLALLFLVIEVLLLRFMK